MQNAYASVDPMNVPGTQKKYAPGKDPFEVEETLKTLVPQNKRQLESTLQAWADYEAAREGGGANKPAVSVAIERWRSDIANGLIEDNIKLQFIRRFMRWLLGTGLEEDHKRTTWGRANVAAVNAEVREYLELFVNKRWDFQKKLLLLAVQLPQTLNQYYLYFKYIVDSDHEWYNPRTKEFNIDPDDFLADWSMLIGNKDDEYRNRNRMLPGTARGPGNQGAGPDTFPGYTYDGQTDRGGRAANYEEGPGPGTNAAGMMGTQTQPARPVAADTAEEQANEGTAEMVQGYGPAEDPGQPGTGIVEGQADVAAYRQAQAELLAGFREMFNEFRRQPAPSAAPPRAPERGFQRELTELTRELRSRGEPVPPAIEAATERLSAQQRAQHRELINEIRNLRWPETQPLPSHSVDAIANQVSSRLRDLEANTREGLQDREDITRLQELLDNATKTNSELQQSFGAGRAEREKLAKQLRVVEEDLRTSLAAQAGYQQALATMQSQLAQAQTQTEKESRHQKQQQALDARREGEARPKKPLPETPAPQKPLPETPAPQKPLPEKPEPKKPQVSRTTEEAPSEPEPELPEAGTGGVLPVPAGAPEMPPERLTQLREKGWQLITELGGQRDQAQAEAEEARKKAILLENEQVALMARVKAYQDEVQTQFKNVEAFYEGQGAAAKATLDSLTADMQKAQHLLAQEAMDKANALEQARRLQNELADSNRRASLLLRQVQDLKTAPGVSPEDMDKIKAQRDQELAKHKAHNAKLKKDLEAATAEINKYAGVEKTLKAELASLSAERTRMIHAGQGLEEEVKRKELERSGAWEAAKKAREHAEKLQAELDRKRAEMEEREEELGQKERERGGAFEAAKGEREKAQKEAEALRKEVARLQKLAGEMYAKGHELEETLGYTEQQREGAFAAAEEREAKIKELTQRLEEAQKPRPKTEVEAEAEKALRNNDILRGELERERERNLALQRAHNEEIIAQQTRHRLELEETRRLAGEAIEKLGTKTARKVEEAEIAARQHRANLEQMMEAVERARAEKKAVEEELARLKASKAPLEVMPEQPPPEKTEPAPEGKMEEARAAVMSRHEPESKESQKLAAEAEAKARRKATRRKHGELKTTVAAQEKAAEEAGGTVKSAEERLQKRVLKAKSIQERGKREREELTEQGRLLEQSLSEAQAAELALQEQEREELLRRAREEEAVARDQHEKKMARKLQERLKKKSAVAKKEEVEEALLPAQPLHQEELMDKWMESADVATLEDLMRRLQSGLLRRRRGE